jgi:Lrp/AsnC family leucine-responsive transcriptional regulator
MVAIMDEIDISIIKHLKQNSRMPYRELADQLGLSMTAIHKRLQALKSDGVVQRFTTIINPALFDALNVLIYGRVGRMNLEETIKNIGASDYTAEVVAAGGNDIYITAYLDDLSELEDYARFVKSTGKMNDAVIGIINPVDAPQPGSIKLSQTDFKIIRALRHDSRRSYSDLAEDLGISVKTVKRRLEKLTENNVIKMTIDFLPESTGDIVAIFNIVLKEGVEVKEAYPLLINKYKNNLVSCKLFNNIPDLVICTFWAGSMKDIKKLQDELLKEAPVATVVNNISYTTYLFYTWLDKLVVEGASSKTEMKKFTEGKKKKKPKKKTNFDLNTLTEFEAYRRALVQALMDGVITSDEEAILRSLRDSLDISEDDHNAIFKLVSFKKQDNIKELETYRRALAQALEDGVITEDEQAILVALKDCLEISDEDHEKLMKMLKRSNNK